MLVQVENVKKGLPYIMFGDGHLASCKPISEADLASFMAECIEDPSKVNKVLPIGGELPWSLHQVSAQGRYIGTLYEGTLKSMVIHDDSLLPDRLHCMKGHDQ